MSTDSKSQWQLASLHFRAAVCCCATAVYSPKKGHMLLLSWSSSCCCCCLLVSFCCSLFLLTLARSLAFIRWKINRTITQTLRIRLTTRQMYSQTGRHIYRVAREHIIQTKNSSSSNSTEQRFTHSKCLVQCARPHNREASGKHMYTALHNIIHIRNDEEVEEKKMKRFHMDKDVYVPVKLVR